MNELNNEIKIGYALSLLIDDLSTIPNIEIVLHDLITQQTLSELDEIIPKDMSIHDSSFPGEAASESIKVEQMKIYWYHTCSEQYLIDAYIKS